MIVSMVSLGCAKNLVDSERMLALLKQNGYVLTVKPNEADIAIVNTCGFIQAAKEEAIDTILELGALKASGSLKKIVVTGCLAERYKDEVAEQFPEVDAVVGIGDQPEIIRVLNEITAGERVTHFAPKCNMPLTGKRIIATLPFFAYLKVAEGCSNGCTYCAIPQIRGKFRSVPMEDVLAEARTLAESGVQELIVIAQDTTRYGEDLYGESRLPELLHELCKIEGFRWIRVLYCYPERLSDELHPISLLTFYIFSLYLSTNKTVQNHHSACRQYRIYFLSVTICFKFTRLCHFSVNRSDSPLQTYHLFGIYA